MDHLLDLWWLLVQKLGSWHAASIIYDEAEPPFFKDLSHLLTTNFRQIIGQHFSLDLRVNLLDFLCNFFQIGLSSRYQHQIEAALGQLHGILFTDALRGACDDRPLTLTKQLGQSLLTVFQLLIIDREQRHGHRATALVQTDKVDSSS